MKDIAEVQLGQDSYAYHGGMDGHPGVSCMVFQTAGSNATELNQNIDELLEEVRKDLPKGVELTQIMSSNDFLFASIHEVVKTLIEAIILVILVVYVFLQDFRSTLIPRCLRSCSSSVRWWTTPLLSSRRCRHASTWGTGRPIWQVSMQ